jgi:hypothetical protein
VNDGYRMTSRPLISASDITSHMNGEKYIHDHRMK